MSGTASAVRLSLCRQRAFTNIAWHCGSAVPRVKYRDDVPVPPVDDDDSDDDAYTRRNILARWPRTAMASFASSSA